jgi:hypothetical protein
MEHVHRLTTNGESEKMPRHNKCVLDTCVAYVIRRVVGTHSNAMIVIPLHENCATNDGTDLESI